MFIVSLTTVQDFDSTFKNYFGEYFSAILTSKLYEIVALEVDQKIPRRSLDLQPYLVGRKFHSKLIHFQ